MDENAATGIKVTQRIEALRNGLFEYADAVRKENARISKLAWRCSVGLFGLGWGLGLLAKLYGVPQAAGGE